MSTDARPSTIDLPEDIQLCHELIRQLLETLNEARRENDQLMHRLRQLLRARFGPRAEKLDEAQLRLFAQQILDPQAAEVSPDREASEAEAEAASSRRKAKGNGGRKALPENLPRQRVVHEVPEEELACPCCGQARTKIGEEISEQLDYVPASLYVVQHVRPKYACKHCQAHVVIADKPNQPIEKGLPGPGLLAQVAVSKYGDHLPLYRLERIFRRHGVDIARSTSCGWMAGMAQLLKPLYDLMVQDVLTSKVLHTDDTPVPVQEKGRGKTRQARMWVYVGDHDHAYTVFDYTPSRSRDGPVNFLASFRGYLQADAYPGYDEIYVTLTSAGMVIEVACWAHTRRYFYDARMTDPARAHTAMAYIRKLYEVEDQVKDLDAKARCQRRQEQSRPILDQFKAWLEEQKLDALPKSPIGQAIRYTLNNWEALARYTEDGDLAIDNNAAENALRAIALGRKNWLFAGSDRGGRTAAILFSLIRSCERHRIDPFVYLRDVIARISDHPMRRLADLLPDQWQVARNPTPQSVPDSTA